MKLLKFYETACYKNPRLETNTIRIYKTKNFNHLEIIIEFGKMQYITTSRLAHRDGILKTKILYTYFGSDI